MPWTARCCRPHWRIGIPVSRWRTSARSTEAGTWVPSCEACGVSSIETRTPRTTVRCSESRATSKSRTSPTFAVRYGTSAWGGGWSFWEPFRAAKRYELVSMGVHTLVLAPADSAAGSEAKRVGATAIDPEDTEAIAAFLGGVRDGTLPALNGESVDYKTLAPRVARVLIHPLPPGAMPSEEFA